MKFQDLFRVAPTTVILLTSFVALFGYQALTGVSIDNPSTQDLIKWGANVLPLSMGDEPWRLLSSAFLHIGLMHLLFNTFAMYFFGQVAEPMFGRTQFLIIFLLSAIGGNLLNNYLEWQALLNGSNSLPTIAAGASGGIMGIGAALLMAALFKFSVNGMVLNLKSLFFIMLINLVYGFVVPGIDNAGHIGGALTGSIIGASIALTYTKSKALATLVPWLVITICIGYFFWIWLDIHQQIALHLR